MSLIRQTQSSLCLHGLTAETGRRVSAWLLGENLYNGQKIKLKVVSERKQSEMATCMIPTLSLQKMGKTVKSVAVSH